MRQDAVFKHIRGIAILLVLFLMVSGCAQLKDKFVQKKKEEELIKQYQTVKAYDVHPNLDLYAKRYVFWKNWHNELLDVLLNSNHKKKTVAIEQVISNLYSMKGMLVDKKGDELQLLIDKATAIEAVIKKERITGGNSTRIRRKIEALGRKIHRDFSYRKIRGFIRDDFRKEQ